MKNLLHEFFNINSDSNEFLETSKQEELENDFDKFQKSKAFEKMIVELIDNMCIQSTSPDIYDKWESVKNCLKQARTL